jgi:hypothetical protein
MMQNRQAPQRHIAGTLTRAGGLLVMAALLLARCSSDALTDTNGSSGRSFTVAAGQEVGIHLQSIGPGEYLAPPAISSVAIRFEDVRLVTPAVPAGKTQLFRFRALRPGRALVTFRHSEQSATVTDTVEVQ